MKTSYLFLAQGFEEIEVVTIVDMLRRAQINIKTVSTAPGLEVTGAHNIVVMADLEYRKVKFGESDFYILPGGVEGTKNLFDNDDFKMNLLDHYNKGAHVAAIGESPSILGNLGMLQDKNATCFPGYQQFLTGATYTGMPIEIQGNVITGRGPSASMKFAIAIISAVKGKDTADKVSKEMMLIMSE